MSNEWKRHTVGFGKHKGDTLYMVYLNDPKYISWVCENCDDISGAEKQAFEDALTWINTNHPHVLD